MRWHHGARPALTAERRRVGRVQGVPDVLRQAEQAGDDGGVRRLQGANPASSLTIDAVRHTLRNQAQQYREERGARGAADPAVAHGLHAAVHREPVSDHDLTADGKTFDAEVEHPVTKRPFKPEITSILDVATRRCVGFSIALKENVISVTEALRNSCCDHGIQRFSTPTVVPATKTRRSTAM